MLKESKITRVHRVIMLCIDPGIKETYENIKLLFDLCKINRISFKFVADFKVLLIINGQQTASATYPCPYCFVTLKDLKDYLKDDVIVDIDEENSSDPDKVKYPNPDRAPKPDRVIS